MWRLQAARAQLLPAQQSACIRNGEHAFRAMLLRIDRRAAPVFAHAAGEIIPRNAARKARADYNNDFVFDVDALIRIEVL